MFEALDTDAQLETLDRLREIMKGGAQSKLAELREQMSKLESALGIDRRINRPAAAPSTGKRTRIPPDQVKAKVMDVIGKEPMLLSEITEAAGLDTPRVRRAVDELSEAGTIKAHEPRQGEGRAKRYSIK